MSNNRKSRQAFFRRIHKAVRYHITGTLGQRSEAKETSEQSCGKRHTYQPIKHGNKEPQFERASVRGQAASFGRKKETKKWFNALGRSTPFGGTKFGLTRSISNVSENVKPLVSLKAYSEAEKKDHAKSAKEISP